ncbi:hypothetical protein BABINDRAFT_5437 [Babjeviella inositovora NRRL Y-12698]|uniref:GSKIP domain-containing protein n=1 Tax=Babjeviella inositovora NRRL Y-12698 TaxID=984486 RepID=A0A1E3QXU5_9ASCO|nr:uncharacterized protein BABINDRAFT_5437 [Babjeviella inositovora NRRL Y-12698]ODQ82476.1 hypothetical protein BABINDRAFT_5437 [Babjeviella inositovora NRRL Y-12698]
MDPCLVTEELTTAKREYESFFKSLVPAAPTPVIPLDFYGITRRRSTNLQFLKGVTLENLNVMIYVSTAGWSIMSQDDNPLGSEVTNASYETFEALMMRVSPGFAKMFNDTLSNKLQGLLNAESLGYKGDC